MSVDEVYVSEYAKFTLQKYATAIAIGILKCKPSNVSATDFCKTIQMQLKKEQNPCTKCCCEKNIKNEEKNRVSKDLTQIFTNTYTESEKELSQVIQDIRDVTHFSQKNDSCINFDVLQSVNNVKKIICNMNGFMSFDNIVSDDLTPMEMRTNVQNTQDSGYQSSQYSNTGSTTRKTADYEQLNNSLKILARFMIQNPDKFNNTSILNYVSEVFGTAIDILCKSNIYLSSLDIAVDTINKTIKSVFKMNYIETICGQQECVRTFYLLNKSYILVQYSLIQLIQELEVLLEKLSRYGASQALELNNPEYIDASFYIFQFLEGLSMRRKENRFNKKKNILQISQYPMPATFSFITNSNLSKSMRETNKKEIDEKLLKERYLSLLNRAAIECVDSYPLITFWAMECINIENSFKS